MNDALVLSGGSIKGAWQCGAIYDIIYNKEYKPNIIRGISVGALNSLFFIDTLAKTDSYKDAAESLVDFWLRNVIKPSDLVVLDKFFIFKLIFGKFSSIYSNEKICNLVYSKIDLENIRRYIKEKNIDYKVGTLNMNTGNMEYISPDHSNFLEYVIGSTSIPILMPPRYINNEMFYDGGLRDATPLKSAIDSGCDRVVAISCQAKNLTYRTFKAEKIYSVGERVITVLINELLEKDVKMLQLYNSLVSNNSINNKRYIDCLHIRPEKELIVDIKSFNYSDIYYMIENGKKTSSESILF